MSERVVFIVVVLTLFPFVFLTTGLIMNFLAIKKIRKEWVDFVMGEKPSYRNIFSTKYEDGSIAGSVFMTVFYLIVSVYAFVGLCVLITYLIAK